MYKSLDLLNFEIIESLRSLEGVISYEDTRNNVLVMSLQLTLQQTQINYPTDGYSLVDLLQESKSGCVTSLIQNFTNVLEKINGRGVKNEP